MLAIGKQQMKLQLARLALYKAKNYRSSLRGGGRARSRLDWQAKAILERLDIELPSRYCEPERLERI